jgi:hypothetical protein
VDIRFTPIDRWPGEHTRRRRPSPFRAGYADTMTLLRTELERAGARDVTVKLAVSAAEIRRDGLPYANARPAHPGVILAFRKADLPLVFPCDTYPEWEANLRAIALSLEALRAVDRYGVTRRAEQYRGWAELPPPAAGIVTPPPPVTADEAAAFVATQAAPLVGQITDPDLRVRATAAGASIVLRDADVFRVLARLAAKRLHPDANGGRQPPEWGRLQEAVAVLDDHHSRPI